MKTTNTNKNKFITLTLGVSCIFASLFTVQGQTMKYKAPEAIDSLNSDAEESLPLYNVTNHTLYLVRTFHEDNVGGKNSGNDIWAFDRTERKDWRKSTHDISVLNNSSSNAVVGIGDHGHKLYLLNHYKEYDKMWPGLSYSQWDPIANDWGAPVNVPFDSIKANNFIYNIYVNHYDDKMVLSMSDHDAGDKSYNLYISEKIAGVWTPPKKLGSTINKTDSDEITPYFSNDGRYLYFSSDRKGGEGGHDIYVSEMTGTDLTKWSEPKNLKDLNSSAFDAYYSEGADDEVYFSSTRGGKLADIYKATPAEKEEKETKTPEFTDSDIISAHPYVNFAFDVHELNNSAKFYLSKVVDSLVMHPHWDVELDGHTDSIGTNSYNRALAKRRAYSAHNYLVNHGIDDGRIVVRYFGEERPKRPNTTEFNRYMNRRVEITFLKSKEEQKEARRTLRKFL
jgi:outer membrane protein OmpA-like peptidoglycan-associated protein